MDGYLSKLSDHLAPARDYVVHADRILNELSRTLQQKSKFSIDRIRPEGGAEKKTSLAYSVDYDVAAFINGESPPFKTVLDDFQDVILANTDVQEEDMKMTSHSLQFSLKGVEFDLLPATNLTQSRSGSAWKSQHKEMLTRIKGSSNVRKAATDNSAGLTEASVEFIKMQTSFVHKVARLAKYWNSTIFYTEYIPGRSSIFELLGVDAGQQEETNNRDGPSMLRAFRLFLTSVKNLKRLKLIFCKFYNRSEIPSNILQQVPLLLDPSSPYNNFMHGFKDSAQDLFSKCAHETLRRLEQVEVQIHLNHGFPDLYMLFLPQPKFYHVRSQIQFPRPENWLIGTTENPKGQPNLIIRRDVLGNNRHTLSYIKKFLSAFLFISEIESQTQSKDIKALAMSKVEGIIDECIDGKNNSWSSSSDTHESRDLTFELPVGRDGKCGVRISCNLV